ncbi:MAG TPA: hypothetical protein VJ805_06550 [Nitrospiraceae bacterium]|nr:hypothetical protein [Nitrospiraceae bacterium]
MSIRRFLTCVPGLLLLATVGCHSIHSRAVRDLIQAEGSKIDAAQTNADAFQKETEERIKQLEEARKLLHESFKSLQKQEFKHRFMMSSYRKTATTHGEAAYAAAYLVSQLYLAEYQGLEKKVWEQFEEDFCALRDTANALNDSWKDAATLHAEVARFANKTALASVDAGLTNAILQQSPRRSEDILRVLDNSRSVNDALEEVVGAGIFRGRALERTHTFTADFVNLLDRLKKESSQ